MSDSLQLPKPDKRHVSTDHSDETLRAFLAGTLSDGEAEALAQVIAGSPSLQQRLDSLSGLNDLIPCHRESASQLTRPSGALRQAIQELRQEIRNTQSPVPPDQTSLSRPGDSSAAATRTHVSEVADSDSAIDSDTALQDLTRTAGIEIRRRIGQGAMGVVYEGYDTRLDRGVCIKVLSPHLASDPVARQRLMHEAQAAAQLQHDNIVSIYGVHQSGGLPVLIQQLIHGESLRERLQREGRLSNSDLERLQTDLARGLETAHLRGVVHRDLKPDNILIESASGMARIADFGLAKRFGSSSLTSEGLVAGSPAYMSPEQTRGETLDGRSDLFSLGIVLYTAATGSNPFSGDDPYVVMDRIRHFSPPPLESVRPDLPAAFCRLVSRLMARDPAERPQSASLLPGASGSVTLIRAGNHGTGPRWLQPRRLAAAAVLLVVCGGMAVLLGSLAESRYGQQGSESSRPSDTAAGQHGPETAEDLPQSTPFAVQSSGRQFETLAEAVAVAADDDAIVVSGDGPFVSGSIVVTARNLTIRSAEGSAPVFRPAEFINSGGPMSFLIGQNGLHLDGLTIDWPVSAAPEFQLENPARTAVIGFLAAENTITRCLITSGERTVAVGVRRASLTLRESLIDATSVGIGWLMHNTQIRAENSWFRGTVAVSLSPPSAVTDSSGFPSLEFQQCTFETQRLLDVYTPRFISEPLRLSVRDSVLNVNELAAVVAMPRVQRDLQTPAGVIRVLTTVVRMQEERCIYRNGMDCISSRRLNQPLRTHSAGIHALPDWLSLWETPSTSSVTADIVRAPTPDLTTEAPGTAAFEFQEASGPVPPRCGADPSVLSLSGVSR